MCAISSLTSTFAISSPDEFLSFQHIGLACKHGYSRYNSDKRAYRLAIRQAQADTKNKYSNESHDSFLRKEGNNFLKFLNANFEKKSCALNKVDGILDPNFIVDSFVRHFKSILYRYSYLYSIDLKWSVS